MTGENVLSKLLASMSPILLDEEYVFCSFQNSRYGDHPELEPFAACVEPEGLTLIIPKLKADRNGISYDSVFRAITLRIHSSLDAVGLTAAVATKLSEYGISANVIAGNFHDHIFVQSEHAEKAMSALDEFVR
ncbi:MAG: ACT domain-containing protein [Pseudomonadales bacterium]